MSSILGTYARKNISFKEGKGTFLYTENGDKYLDWVAGIATNILDTAIHILSKLFKISLKNLFTFQTLLLYKKQNIWQKD